LGILANLLSCSSILNTLPVLDEKLSLVETVIGVAMSTAQVPILVQAFAVLRRVIWYLRNVEPMPIWIKAFTTDQFLSVVNFLLKSSTNGQYTVELSYFYIPLILARFFPDVDSLLNIFDFICSAAAG